MRNEIMSRKLFTVRKFKNINPTAENIVWVIWERLRARLDQKFSLSVRLYETPRNFVTYKGE